METLAAVLVGLVAAEHLGFLVLEMYYWEKPLGLRVFRNTPEAAAASAMLAANQGLYNGFLAAGLVWSLIVRDPNFAAQIQTFFLSCVIVAGTYGSYSGVIGALTIQAMPAAAALALVALTA